MIYSTLDSSRQDESNDSKIIPIGAIFAEIAIFAKFQVGSGRVNCLTRPEFSGRVGSGTRISGQKCGALANLSFSECEVDWEKSSRRRRLILASSCNIYCLYCQI